MSWVRIHDAALSHPKVVGLSDRGFRLWVWGLSYAQTHLTDGAIPVPAMPSQLRRAAPELHKTRLWECGPDGTVIIHDYLDWNDSREVVTRKRLEGRNRLQSYREKRVSPLSTVRPLARSGVVLQSSLEEKETEEFKRAGNLLECYAEWYSRFRNGAKLRLLANSLQWDDARTLVRTWDDARLAQLAQIVLTTDDEWVSNTDRGFHIFALKASWADDRLKAVEKERAG